MSKTFTSWSELGRAGVIWSAGGGTRAEPLVDAGAECVAGIATGTGVGIKTGISAAAVFRNNHYWKTSMVIVSPSGSPNQMADHQ